MSSGLDRDFRVKVLFLNSCVSGGGAGRSLETYFKYLSKNIEAHVVMPEPGVIGENLKNVERIWYIPEFVERIHRSPYRFLRNVNSGAIHLVANWVAVPRAISKITKLARELRPDVIYCNHMLANPVGAFVGWKLNLPVVFHARNIHVAYVGRKFYRFLAGLNCVKRIICNSLASSLIYREYTESKVRVVYNFVDLQKFDRRLVEPTLRKEFGISPNALVIGYLGRILPKKGIRVLLDAFKSIYDQFPTAVLAIVGENDGGVHRDLRAEYKDYAQQLGILDRIHFIGFREDIRPFVTDFDILALPSIEPESFGRVLIEAMAFGIPSVVAAHGGAVEVVKHGLNGLWSRPRDVPSLATALAKLLADKDLRNRLGHFGETSVRDNFSGQELSRRISEILVTVAAENSPAAFAQPEQRRIIEAASRTDHLTEPSTMEAAESDMPDPKIWASGRGS